MCDNIFNLNATIVFFTIINNNIVSWFRYIVEYIIYRRKIPLSIYINKYLIYVKIKNIMSYIYNQTLSEDEIMNLHFGFRIITQNYLELKQNTIKSIEYQGYTVYLFQIMLMIIQVGSIFIWAK